MRTDYIAGANGALRALVPMLESTLDQKKREVARLEAFIAHAKLMASEGESVTDEPGLKADHPALDSASAATRGTLTNNVEEQADALITALAEARGEVGGEADGV